jgi:hypothetical protein
MAYAIPPQWSHGNQPTAVLMTKYADALNDLYTGIGTVGYNPATPYSQYVDTQEYTFAHSQQYLIYVSSGAIHDPTGVETDVSLGNSGDINSYDLDQVGWLTYGKAYYVIGCSACMESDVGI